MGGHNETPDLNEVIRLLAVADWQHQARADAGLIRIPEAKAYEARRAELIAQLDELRGTADMTYEQFRAAFDEGAGCRTLFELRNAMHPKDPLKADATSDLRAVGCFTPQAVRNDAERRP